MTSVEVYYELRRQMVEATYRHKGPDLMVVTAAFLEDLSRERGFPYQEAFHAVNSGEGVTFDGCQIVLQEGLPWPHCFLMQKDSLKHVC